MKLADLHENLLIKQDHYSKLKDIEKKLEAKVKEMASATGVAA